MKTTRPAPLNSESYVLRLYRQEQDDRKNLPGILEEPVSGQRWSFTNMSELKQILEDIERLQEKTNEV